MAAAGKRQTVPRREARLAVAFVVGLLAEGWSRDEIKRQYPGVNEDDIAACLAYARDAPSAERVFALL